MLRLYLPDAVVTAEAPLRIDGAELRHLHTLRLGAGDRVCVLDGQGGEHDAVLEQVGARAATARVVASRRPVRESPLVLTLAPALLKGAHIDLVVEKATELGVARIAPVLTRHAVARAGHVDRWRRIAVAAAKQSGRTTVPTVEEAVALPVLLDAPFAGVRVLPWEGERTCRLRDLPATAAAVLVLIGPEGGFAAEEVALARDRGFATVSLGPRILRAETAAIATVAACQQRWGDG